MFEPIRGGTRGGQAEFKWADVSADKDRENYLGHSINAPTGRWQKNKDVHWYSREKNDTEAQRLEEIRKIKEAEADALAVALGFTPEPKGPKPDTPSETNELETDAQRLLNKEEKKRRKAERKEERRANREKRRLERSANYDDRDRELDRRRKNRSRSRSPARRSRDRERDRDRRDYSRHRSPNMSRTPPRRTRDEYDVEDQEKERQRDRRRWDSNASRDEPGARSSRH